MLKTDLYSAIIKSEDSEVGYVSNSLVMGYWDM